MTRSQLAQLTVDSPEQMHALGVGLAAELTAGDLLVLTGPLGAGKTTLTRGLGEGLGVIGQVSSPTFVIARTHRRENSAPNLIHVDAYRLGSPIELDDLDIDFAGSIVVVEWGAGFFDEAEQDFLEVVIERDSSGESETRTVSLTGVGARWSKLSADAQAWITKGRE